MKKRNIGIVIVLLFSIGSLMSCPRRATFEGTQFIVAIDRGVLSERELEKVSLEFKEILFSRIDELAALGAKEPFVLSLKPGEFMVKLPYLKDSAAALAILVRKPSFELRLLERGFNINEVNRAEAYSEGIPILKGGDVKRVETVEAENSVNGSPKVVIEFNENAREALKKITEENIGRNIGVLLDGRLLIAPKVVEPILDGRIKIAGQYRRDETELLYRAIRCCVFPVNYSVRLVPGKKSGMVN